MRNVMKATTLESRFPLLAVEHGCIISKDADITAAFEVELPEVYTVTAEEYEGIHATWCKAIKVLPDYSVLHKQDWYVKEEYRPDWKKTGTGFLARSNGMHFNERPFLNSPVLPVPDQDDEGAHEAAEQLEHAVPGTHHSERDTG